MVYMAYAFRNVRYVKYVKVSFSQVMLYIEKNVMWNHTKPRFYDACLFP